MTDDPTIPIRADLLLGADAIARFLGISRRQVYALVYSNTIPSFKAGKLVAARKSSLTRWMDEQEQNAAALADEANHEQRDLRRVMRERRENTPEKLRAEAKIAQESLAQKLDALKHDAATPARRRK